MIPFSSLESFTRESIKNRSFSDCLYSASTFAFAETWRVLKPGGDLIACFYIRGKNKRTDWLVKNILAKKGWFTPPFQTEEELRDTLSKLYRQIDIHVDGSMVYFCCVK